MHPHRAENETNRLYDCVIRSGGEPAILSLINRSNRYYQLSNKKRGPGVGPLSERKTGLEPATLSLGS